MKRGKNLTILWCALFCLVKSCLHEQLRTKGVTWK
nr:MAG TPA: hypothetical protein [Caudoviricetes sp.]